MLVTAYQLLNILQSATSQQIKEAYRKQALIHHPDKPGGDIERMKLINQAYEVLTKNRAAYDRAIVPRKREEVVVVYAGFTDAGTPNHTCHYTWSAGTVS